MTMRQPAPDLVCSVCRQASPWMAQRCTACGAVLRDRVPSLHLFSTAWQLVSDPHAAFVAISRSEQKNYVYLLFALQGPLPATLALGAAHVADGAMDFGMITVMQWGGGLLLGLIAGGILSLTVAHLLTGSRAGYRLWSALLAYAMLPMGLATLTLLPVLMAVFGRDLYSTNPWPFELDPTSFWTLTTLLGAAVVVSLWRWVQALRLHVDSVGRATVALVAVLLIHTACIALFASLIG